MRVTLNERLTAVRRKDGRLEADLYNEYAHATRQRIVDQVVVEHGTLPSVELYFALKPGSSNVGEVDEQRCWTCARSKVRRNPYGRYQLFPIGDAVAQPQHSRRGVRRLPALSCAISDLGALSRVHRVHRGFARPNQASRARRGRGASRLGGPRKSAWTATAVPTPANQAA